MGPAESGLSETFELEIALGLLFVGLTLYASTLSYALRGYSRGRLAEYMSDKQQRIWFERLDRAQSELQTAAGSVRLLAIAATLSWAVLKYFGDAELTLDWVEMAPPLLISVLVLLIVAVGVPHALANHAGEAVLARSLTLLWLLRIALYPVQKCLLVIDFIVRRLLGKSEQTEEEAAERLEQEILDAVSEGELHGAVDEKQKEIIESVFELHDTQVSEIMTPRTDIVALPADVSFAETRAKIIEAGHSRIPVFEKSLDQIIGVLYAKDLIRLGENDDFDAHNIMRTVPYVPETKTIDELLRQLRSEKVHMAIVLDEYGGTAGLVSIEDILEELVGEIDDEYDQEAPPEINTVDNDTLEVDARVHVDDLNDALDIQIPDNGDYDTIGGFVFSALGKIPDAGEEFQHENIIIKVTDAEPRRINRLRIHVNREDKHADGTLNGK